MCCMSGENRCDAAHVDGVETRIGSRDVSCLVPVPVAGSGEDGDPMSFFTGAVCHG